MSRHSFRLGLVVTSVLTMWACLGTPPQDIVPYDQMTASIIGGKDDTRHPAVGSLQAQRNSFCTGTLVASRLVLTAAHCITSAQQRQNQGTKIEFRVDTPSGNGVTSKYYEVGTMATHPQYGRTSRGRLLNDLGYAVLKSDATGVTTMPVNATAMANSWVNRKILFLGYGVIQTQPSRRGTNIKQGAEITLRTLESDRFETRDSGVSICSGDSGGPALYSFNGTMTLIGVNSYVTGNSTAAGPLCNGSGWSFRIDPYMSWLQPLMNKHGGKCKADSDCGPCYRCDASAGKCVLKGTTKAATYCKACSGPSDCGGSNNLCQRQASGNRCLQACDANGCCPLGTSCQQLNGQGQCVPDAKVCPDLKCAADTDCGPGEQCTGGLCKPKPVAPSATLCKKCAADADCGQGASCHTYPDGKYCTQPCVSDNFCPTGYSCQLLNNTRQCLPTGGSCKCTANTDCHTGFVCQNGICLRQGGGKYGDACDNTRKCATGYACLSGSCFQACTGEFPPGSPGSYCNGRSCASGTQCLGAGGVPICLQRCTSDSNCTRGGKCTSFGNVSLCICGQDSDCKRGFACNKSLSSRFASCAEKKTSTQCDNGFDCIYTGGSTERCLPPPTQEAGEQCDSVKRCKAGMRCLNTSSGGSICLRTCSSSRDCAEGGSCSRTNAGNLCLCNTNTTCKSGYICQQFSGSTGTCSPGKCEKDADCGAGQTCDNGLCKATQPAGCRTDADCAGGTICKEARCVPPTQEPPAPDAPAPDAPAPDASTPELPSPDVPGPQPDGTSVCFADQECPANHKCIGGKCIEILPQEPTPDAGPADAIDKNIDGANPTQDNGARPPSTGCGGCQISSTSDAPVPPGLWCLILLMIPLLRRKRRA